MLKERSEFIRNLLSLVDVLAVSINFFFIYYLLQHHEILYQFDIIPTAHVVKSPHSLDMYVQAYWLALFIWAVLLRKKGQHHLRFETYPKVIGECLINSFIFLFLFASFAFLFKLDFLSRFFMISYAFSSALLLAAVRLSAWTIAYYVRKKGHYARNLILVGTGKRAQDFISSLDKHAEWGYRVIGLLDKDKEMVGQSILGHPVIGVLEDLPKILESNVVDQVIFVVPRSWLETLEQCILYCEAVGVPATLMTDFFDLAVAAGVPQKFEGFTYLTFDTSRLRDSELLLKRAMDIFASAFFLIITAPVFVVVPILIKTTSQGPIFFKQKRMGRNGREFMLYKFRSMVVGAEARLEDLKALNEMSGPVFKITNDPRVTKIGKFLRRTSLDEFPQFWNVLRGDMSLVGPRPPIKSEVEKYEPWQRRRLSMKPGITCIWQVSGRNKIGFEEWARLDLQYIDRWSLWLDIKILVLTVRAVATGHGAK